MKAKRSERRAAARAERPHARRQRSSVWRGRWPYLVSGLAIVAAIGWSVLSSRSGTTVPTGGAADAVVAAVTSVPASTFDAVGSGGTAAHLRATSLALLRGPSGKPVIVYVGAEYCPYCASERWSLVAALSRFGTFRGLGLTASSSTDVFPNTPTLSFRDSTYSSELIELSAVETADRSGNAIAQPTALQQASFDRSDPQGSIPFLSIADRFTAVGSGYPPDVLAGRSHAEIAAALSDPSSPMARAVLGNADRITAAICQVTAGAPTAVCSSPSVRSTTAP